MNKLLFLTLLILFGFTSVQAQSTQVPVTPASPVNAVDLPALAQGSYPLSVVFKVKDLTSIVTLSSAQQVSLADFFVQEEKALSESMEAAGTAPQHMGQLRSQLAAKFQALLTPEQLAAYSAKRPNSQLAVHSYSRPATATYKP